MFVGDPGGLEGGHLAQDLRRRLHDRQRQAGAGPLPQPHLEVDHRVAPTPEHFRLWFDAPHLVRLPGGESLQDLVARTADVVRMAIDAHPDETVALVGHDSVNRAMLLPLLDQPLSAYWRLAQSPAAISDIDLTGGRIKVQRINDTAHLKDGPSGETES